MKSNGYVDATEFSNCKMIGDSPDEAAARAAAASSGTVIDTDAL